MAFKSSLPSTGLSPADGMTEAGFKGGASILKTLPHRVYSESQMMLRKRHYECVKRAEMLGICKPKRKTASACLAGLEKAMMDGRKWRDVPDYKWH
ncbi:hypothetical protein CFIMG_008198RA00001 [Ceratocystis fimbriata CBS 114723]|uniref:Uncharacterized protein n=1 Tax=Ceratocystis fimbriata CBS 114723 TaxID=1035309 RepID=A0A2C5X743_9PEZI|nr:hypothetical protein CFIMG_008198RA00001 [Ceratocystis fimbriata CBS 114723]